MDARAVRDFAPARRAHPGVLVQGIDEVAAALEKAGRPVAWDPHLPGHRRFYTADDHGNRIEYLEAIRG